MFVIQDISTGLYFHKGGKIIIFETIEKAQWFHQNFFNWSMGQLLSQGQAPFEAMTKQQVCQILPCDFTVDENVTIMFSEIEK